MFHPVGSQSPSVYWRRRLLTAGAAVILVVLLAVTISALTSGSSGSPAGGSSRTPVAAGDTTRTSAATHAASSSITGRAPSDTAAHSSSSTKRTHGSSVTNTAPNTGSSSATAGSSSATVEKCRSSDLKIAAAVGDKSYRVGQDPMVELQVTNDGSAPCAQDLADPQVVLKVYNGVSRVWGSHDCQITPGTTERTLAVGAPVQVSVSWSGETSQPGCSGRRQHVGAGTYTLYASLSGKTGTSARFTIS